MTNVLPSQHVAGKITIAQHCELEESPALGTPCKITTKPYACKQSGPDWKSDLRCTNSYR